MPQPTRRDIQRGIEQVDPPDEPQGYDPADVWVAFLEARHPLSMETLTEERVLRAYWIKYLSPDPAVDHDGQQSSWTPEQVEAVDQRIRDAIGTR